MGLKEIAKKKTVGCPLFEGRNKGDWDTIQNQEVTLIDAYPMEDYFVVILEEMQENFYLAGKCLVDILSTYLEECEGDMDTFRNGIKEERLRLKQKLVKKKNGQNFRKFEVI